MILNKDHWYDGFFYEKLIAPNQDGVFRIIKSLITENSVVFDAGCGTGRLALQLQDKCSHIDAVDLSRRNINIANKILGSKPSDKIFYYHDEIHNFLKSGGKHYNFSIMSFVIHEINENKREEIIQTLSEYSDYVIIADYLSPVGKNLWTLLNKAVELAAGKEHYNGYKSYIAGRGITGLAERAGLNIIKEIKNNPLTSHIVLLK